MEFAERMETLIDNGMFDEFVRELLNPVNVDRVRANGMELITQVCSKGINEVEETDPNLTIWLEGLDYIVEHANPKEAYAALLEQSVVFAHTNKFIYLLQPIQVVFAKLPMVRASHMEGILKHIQFHIKSYLNVPDYIKTAEWDGKETLAIEEDPQMRRIIQSYNYCLTLITAFVTSYTTVYSSSIAKEPKVVEDLGRRESLLRNTLVNLLGKPLVYFDLQWVEDKANQNSKVSNVKTEGRVIAEKIMNLLADLHVDVHCFFDWLGEQRFMKNKGPKLPTKTDSNIEQENDTLSDDESYFSEYEPELDVVSVANYFYLLLDQNVGADHICTVYTPSYIFNTVLAAIVPCLDCEENMILKKSTALTSKLLYRCNPPNPVTLYGLKSNMIQSENHKNFIEKIVTVIIYCKILSVRRGALEALRRYLWAFDGYGRFMLLVRGFDVIEHSGLLGYLIVQLKEFVREALYDAQASSEMKEYFSGERLRGLLQTVCSLKDGETTDIADNSDQIISALNLVRYLLLTDGAANKSGFYSSMEVIEKKLLSPLHTALDFSKAHFEQELRVLNENPSSVEKRPATNGVESTVLIDGKEVSTDRLSEVPVADKIASVKSALSAFDMMFSLLARVDECYSQAKASQI